MGSQGLLSAHRWMADAGGVLAMTLVILATCTANGALLFPGALEVHLPQAIGAVVLGAALLMYTASRGGRLPVVSTGPDSSTTPALAALSAGIAASVSAHAALPTVLLALTLASVLVGLVWTLIGRSGAADLVRNVPFPVAAGFVCANGWLLLTGGLGVAVGHRFDVYEASQWWSRYADERVAVALGMGVTTLWLTRRWASGLTLPLAIAAAALAVHAGLALSSMGLAQARDEGWLLPAFHPALPMWIADAAVWEAVQWQAIAGQAGLITVTLIVSTLSLLLSLASLERAYGAMHSPSQDLRAAGLSNLATAAFGGLFGGISMSNSVLAWRSIGHRRLMWLLPAGLCVALVAAGASVLSLVPRAVMGGLLAFMGLGILYTWLIERRKAMPRKDYAVIVALTALTVTLGLMVSVFAGVLWCCLEFAWSAARRSPVRRMLDRRAWPTRVERSQPEMARLLEIGSRFRIVELQGSLFFGSVLSLRELTESVLSSADRPQVWLFDLTRVSGVDLSAGQALADAFSQIERAGIAVQMALRDHRVREALRRCGAVGFDHRPEFTDAESAIAAWDDEALAADPLPPFDLADWIARQLPPGSPPAHEMLKAFRPLALSAGEVLFNQGTEADAMFLVLRGRLEIVLPMSDRRDVRLRVLQPGSCIGEMAFLRGGARTATVRALEDSALLRLDRDQLQALHAQHPDRALALYRLVIAQMAGRIDQLTAQVSR